MNDFKKEKVKSGLSATFFLGKGMGRWGGWLAWQCTALGSEGGWGRWLSALGRGRAEGGGLLGVGGPVPQPMKPARGHPYP